MAAASLRFCVCFFQNDEVFTFRFNVIVSDGSGGWLSHLVSEVCSGLIWTHREIICEEDYMEVRTPTPPGRSSLKSDCQ